MIDTVQKLTVKDASELSGYSIDYIRKLCSEGKIAYTKFGFALAIDKESLMKYRDAHPKTQKAE
jgi:excisionase family DNA binding protein